MSAAFLDPAVLLFAVGGAHPQREPCRALLAAAETGILEIHLSVEGGQEFLFHRLRRCERGLAVAQFDALNALAQWHPFDQTVLRSSRDLVAAGLARGRDAVHAATAMRAGFPSIVSPDRDFDGIPGLARVDPVDWEPPPS